MTTRKTPYSPNIFANEASLSTPASRPIGGRLHDSSPFQADAGSGAPMIFHNTSPSLQNNAAAGGKSRSITPDLASVRMEKAVMQSCWIQRLNSICQTSAVEEEKLSEPSHVWTHFTKDFSSCSKRLHKARPHKACHHTRSSSWPPNERTTKCSPSPDVKLVEPVNTKEQYLLSRSTLPEFQEQTFRVPFQDGSENTNFCFKTGNLFSKQNSSCKSTSTLEAFVACSHAARTSDDFHDSESKDGTKLKSSAVQLLFPKFNKESESPLEVSSARVLGDAPCIRKFSVSELAYTKSYTRGSSPDAVIGTSLSPALMGASADADDRICRSPPLTKSVYLSTPSKLSINKPAAVFGDTAKKVNEVQLGVASKKYSGKICGKEMKNRQNFGFLHVAGKSKKLNQLGANPCIYSGPCNCGSADNVGAYDRDSSLPMAFKSAQGKRNVGPFVSKELNDLPSFNTDLWRHDPVVADHAPYPKEELNTRMPLTRVSSGDFLRASCRETSLDEYWVQLFEDSRPMNPSDTSYPKASPPQEYTTDECHRFSFNLTANIGKLDENEKLTSFHQPCVYIPLNSNSKTCNSFDVPKQTQAPLKSSFIQTKRKGLGHNECASFNRSPLEGTSVLKEWQQEESHQGGIRRLASKNTEKEPVGDNRRTTEPTRSSKAWIQRWRPSSNSIAMSGKSLPAGIRVDKELGLAMEKRPVITSYKGEKDMDCVDRKLLEPARTSKLRMECSTRHYDSGLQATPRGSVSVPKGHHDALLRVKYMPPSVKAMAIIGNMAGKPHAIPLENRGSFSVWPCPSKEEFQVRQLPELQETVEDNMHGMDMDDLEFSEWKMT